MRQLIDQLRRKAAPWPCCWPAASDDKVTLIAGLSRDLEANGARRRRVGPRGGRSGRRQRRRRPDMAQAGGKHPEKLPEALDAARKEIHRQLSGQNAPRTT